MNCKRKKDPKFISRSCPKTVYMFEFMNSNRSWLDPLGLSNTYLNLDTYNSIKVLFYCIQSILNLAINEKKDLQNLSFDCITWRSNWMLATSNPVLMDWAMISLSRSLPKTIYQINPPNSNNNIFLIDLAQTFRDSSVITLLFIFLYLIFNDIKYL